VFSRQGAPALGEGALRTGPGLAALRAAAAAHLSPAGQLQVATALDMLATVEARMEVLRTQLLYAARHLMGAKVLAAQLYGVGPVTALALTCWLAGAGRFSSSRKAVRFTGLDITVWSSDRKGPPGRLSRQGPPVLRWAVYEAGKTHARASARTFACGGPRMVAGLAAGQGDRVLPAHRAGSVHRLGYRGWPDDSPSVVPAQFPRPDGAPDPSARHRASCRDRLRSEPLTGSRWLDAQAAEPVVRLGCLRTGPHGIGSVASVSFAHETAVLTLAAPVALERWPGGFGLVGRSGVHPDADTRLRSATTPTTSGWLTRCLFSTTGTGGSCPS
jgi:hypothetical protein